MSLCTWDVVGKDAEASGERRHVDLFDWGSVVVDTVWCGKGEGHLWHGPGLCGHLPAQTGGEEGGGQTQGHISHWGGRRRSCCQGLKGRGLSPLTQNGLRKSVSSVTIKKPCDWKNNDDFLSKMLKCVFSSATPSCCDCNFSTIHFSQRWFHWNF